MKRILLTLAFAGASTALAEGATCDTSGEFMYSGVARVISGKLHFRDNRQKQTRRYVVKGDFVAVRNIKGYGACVLYIGKNGRESAGWLDNAGLDAAPDPGFQDLPSTWIMVRNQAFTLDLNHKSNNLELLTAQFSKVDKLPITLTGTLRLEAGVGPAFMAAGQLSGKAACNLSGVLLNGFLRLFSGTPACRAFAGVYASEGFFVKE